jgi:hypothetical protein
LKASALSVPVAPVNIPSPPVIVKVPDSIVVLF